MRGIVNSYRLQSARDRTRVTRHVKRYYRKDKVGEKSDKRRLEEFGTELLFGGVDSMPWRCGATPPQMRFRFEDIDIYRIDKAIS